MEKKSCMPMKEARVREEPVIRRFIIAMVIPAMQKGAIMVPVLLTLNFILMIAEPCMTGMETDTGVTDLRPMTAEDTVILPVEEEEVSRVTVFPAA